ncbi:LytR family transcriptional regulator [Rhodococcus ruber Chol-4]|uniref:LCP family protein n=1 Tax=Rhodococcus ruber TaxID=1830 RepID=UPI0003499062|nr:LCP family protein [Rhodococcus ruber]KXF86892.1 LytR family transcriptional regulator [Rhodococcus ruber Chol-4]
MPPEPPTRRAPARDAGGGSGVLRGRPLRIAVAVAAALTLVATGVAWRGIDSLRSSLATVGGLTLGDGRDGALDILLVGTDSRTDAHGNPLSQRELDALRAGEEVANNTDTIILIRVPLDGTSATAISIPRDTYVEVPDIGMSKINAAFGATKETERLRLVEAGESGAAAEKAATQAGREALVESVADLTGVTVDHYAEVGLLGFVLLTDAVGGVDVCLNNAVDEPLSGANFPAGEQTLDGADALSFVRQRHDLPRGDLDRIVRQQVFMASLVQKVLSAKTLSNPSKLNQLSAAVQRSVVLDSDWDILDLATRMQDLAGGAVQFSTIPVQDLNAMTDYGESVVQVDPEEVRSFVADLVDPGDGGSQATTDPAPDVEAGTITVDVANAGGVAGLASRVAAALVGDGFVEGGVGNHTGRAVDESTVFAADPRSDQARAVAAALGGLATAADPALDADTVRVVLTEDYTGPGADASVTSVASGSELVSAGATPTSVPPGPPIDAGSTGPRCVN